VGAAATQLLKQLLGLVVPAGWAHVFAQPHSCGILPVYCVCRGKGRVCVWFAPTACSGRQVDCNHRQPVARAVITPACTQLTVLLLAMVAQSNRVQKEPTALPRTETSSACCRMPTSCAAAAVTDC
jgi:hypothetical protein